VNRNVRNKTNKERLQMKTYLIYNTKGEIVARIKGTQIFSVDNGTTFQINAEQEVIALIPSHNVFVVCLDQK